MLINSSSKTLYRPSSVLSIQGSLSSITGRTITLLCLLEKWHKIEHPGNPWWLLYAVCMIPCLLVHLFQELQQQLWLASQRWCVFPAWFNPQSQTWCKRRKHKTWSNKKKRNYDCGAAVTASVLTPRATLFTEQFIAWGFLGCVCFFFWRSEERNVEKRASMWKVNVRHHEYLLNTSKD